MDKLIEQALKENKIVRYIPTFVKVLETYKSLLEAENEQLNIHGVMQGCQCKDRLGETTVWCCNQCGLPCEEGWLPTHKAVGSRLLPAKGGQKHVGGGCIDRTRKKDGPCCYPVGTCDDCQIP